MTVFQKLLVALAVVALPTIAQAQELPPGCGLASEMPAQMEEMGYFTIWAGIMDNGEMIILYSVKPEGDWMIHTSNGVIECHTVGGNYNDLNNELLFGDDDSSPS